MHTKLASLCYTLEKTGRGRFGRPKGGGGVGAFFPLAIKSKRKNGMLETYVQEAQHTLCVLTS